MMKSSEQVKDTSVTQQTSTESEIIDVLQSPSEDNEERISEITDNSSLDEVSGVLNKEEKNDTEEIDEQLQETRERIAEKELQEALSAAGIDPSTSTCEELHQLAKELEEGKSPFFKKMLLL